MSKPRKRKKLKKVVLLPAAVPREVPLEVELEVKLPVPLAQPPDIGWERRGKRLLIKIRDFVLGS